MGSPPWGTIEIVPSAAIDSESYGGTVIGPDPPITGKPSPVCSTPDGATSRSPRRVYASLPSVACTAIHAEPVTATSRLRPVCCTAPGVRSASVTSSPAGLRASKPGPSSVSRSNTTRSARKPVVDAFAMLLAIAACAAMCALSPEAAV